MWLIWPLSIYIAGVLIALVYKSLNPERSVRTKDLFNPRSWVSFVMGSFFVQLIPPHVVEQLALRLYDDECGNICVKQGFCYDCGCSMPAKAMDPNASCSLGNWGPIEFDKEKYRKIREKYPVQIKINYLT